ncbi:MAG: protein translocase subunit SecF [Alphaproteobacteria bacterium]|nr:protein translocase subunit SecF [Alphaproteobacteria bacterium]
MARLTIIPDNTKIDFVGNRILAFAIDGLLVIATILSLWFQGLNLGIDFTGGVVIEASSSKPINFDEVREKIVALGFKDPTVQQFGDNKSLLVRIKPTSDVSGHEQEASVKIKTALGSDYTFKRVDAVGPKVSNELFQTGILATTLGVIMIGIYVAFRFEWQFGVSAVLATGHDVLVAVGLYSMLQFDFNLTSVAALLLLAGYSVNDTVVVFDRIRENRRLFKRMPFGDIINLSTNQTLSRTFLTSFTTALSVIPLLLFGGEVLFGFAATILWGIVVGTYSSVFVASCVLLYLPAMQMGQATDEKAGGVQA